MVDGVPFSPYLSFGAAVYSETTSISEQASQAEARMSADNIGVSYSGELVENVGDLFRMYEHLPIAFAVYYLSAPEQDAVILYANRSFLKHNNYTRATLLGKTVRETFPMTGEHWYEMARRAALDGETSKEILYYALKDVRLYTTASQVIGSGYVAFTYQWDILPSPDMDKHKDANLVIDDSAP